MPPNFDGARMRQIRLQRKISAETLARRIGRTLGVVRRYESGDLQPSREALLRLADVLGVRVEDLLDDPVDAA